MNTCLLHRQSVEGIDRLMTETYFDHVDQQYSYALIGPLRDQLRVLELRARHFANHVRMSDEDRATITQVQTLLEQTRAELDRLQQSAEKPVS
jgi:hypothetical protein